MRVIIIGAGLGGLCLAHGLKKAGVEVYVFERQSENLNNPSGYGIHIDLNGKQALRHCIPYESWVRFQHASTPAGTQLFFRDTQLRLLAEKDDTRFSTMTREDVERRGIGRIEFRDILLEGLNDSTAPVVRWNKKFTHYTLQPDDRVRVHFDDKTSEEGDILVGADGANSRVRQQLLPHIKRVDLGIRTIAGRCEIDHDIHRVIPSSLLDGSLNNIVPHGKGWMFISAWKLPLSTSRSPNTEIRQHIVWAYVTPQQESYSSFEGSSSQRLKDFVLEEIRDWSAGLQDLVRNSEISNISHIPLRTMPKLEAWESTNVTLLGDAIHNMTPMAGVGANTALRDSELLAKVLVETYEKRGQVGDAIGRYEKEMRLYANRAVQLSRRNAENASSGQSFQRSLFLLLLRVARSCPLTIRRRIGF
ncbi:FAD/NAD(P)-binding domain-containing protein [Viridothelium virens]|uniref:FAD/NAD(P)-binding domain-containing protein n=1 Tax=Viridothelium virens TaxID=1048519 RepID=A0A6A6H7Q1_VIRVR|nr:FAD/NAD(P)-binding domain-containing protein [Viridothelium virens]